MRQYSGLTPEERAQITDIQDLLIDRYVALKEALQQGNKIRVNAIEAEIKELRHEKGANRAMGDRLTGLPKHNQASPKNSNTNELMH